MRVAVVLDRLCPPGRRFFTKPAELRFYVALMGQEVARATEAARPRVALPLDVEEPGPMVPPSG